MILTEAQFGMRLDQQEQFATAANQLVSEVRDSIRALNQNQPRHLVVNEQRSELDELIEQTKKLIGQRNGSDRDMGNRQAMFPHQFAQMKQRQSDFEKELLTGLNGRLSLFSQDTIRKQKIKSR